MERDLFGSPAKDSTAEPLAWKMFRKDNLLIRKLKKSVVMMGHAVEQDARQTVKSLKNFQRF